MASQLRHRGAVVTTLDIVALSADQGPETDHLIGDVRDFDFAQLEPFDLLVANAGVFDRSDTGELTDDAIERLVSINFTGVVRTLFAPRTASARALITCSGSAVASNPGVMVYGASKAAVLQYAYAYGAVYPTTVALVGPTDTGLWENAAIYNGHDSSTTDRFVMPASAIACKMLEAVCEGRELVVTYGEILPDLHAYASWMKPSLFSH